MIEVVAAVVIAGSRFLMVPRDDGDLAGLFEFPGGKVEPGESWAEAVARELVEELDLSVIPGAHLLTLEHDYPKKRVRLHFIACTPTPALTAWNPPPPAAWFTLTDSKRLDCCPADARALALLPWRSILPEAP